MFLLKSIGSAVFGSGANSSENKSPSSRSSTSGGLAGQHPSPSAIITLPEGQFLYLDPNRSPTKGALGLVYHRASASIRKTTTPHQYQLVIEQIGGQDSTLDKENDADNCLHELELEEEDIGSQTSTRRRSFLLDSVLEFQRIPSSARSAPSFVWKDMEEDEKRDDREIGKGSCGWTFVIDEAASDALVDLFEQLIYSYMFERSRAISHKQANPSELQAFIADLKKLGAASSVGRSKRIPAVSKAAAPPPAPSTPARMTSSGSSYATPMSTGPTAPSTPVTLAKNPTAPVGTSIISTHATLYLYDVRVNQFVTPLQDSTVAVDIIRTDTFNFSLLVSQSNGTPFITQPIEPKMSPTFNKAHGSFVWVWFDEETHKPMYSWSLVFAVDAFEDFQAIFSRSIFESLHLARLVEGGEEDAYNRLAYQEDVEMRDAEADEQGDEEEEDSADEAQADEDDESDIPTNDAKNSQLAVGFNHDRSFVVRGSSIGVFKHTDDDKLKFSTNIGNIKTMDGTLFSPRKVMLHEQDSAMLMMNPADPHSIMKMDLEYGKVVEQWNVDEILPVDEIIPEKKYAQCTGEKTFIGINHNSLFRIDPRQAGHKRVDSQSKQYVSKNKFSCATTTGTGEVAVASEKGDIRLFNKLNVRAKTQLPGLGDPIIGIDTTDNGRWVIATCKTYLLLIDTSLEDGKTGFNKGMGAEKPVPRRLQLKPEHVAWMAHPISFTPARFNTVAGGGSCTEEERAIITSTGPFVITWNFRRLKAGRLYDYTIKEYREAVVADNFKFGQHRSIIVALPEHVEMVSKNKLSTPTKLLKTNNSIVNSPY